MPARMLFAERTNRTVGFVATILVVSSGFAIPSTAQGSNPRPEVIYGEDNRLDLFDAKVPDNLRKLARSTAVLMKSSDLTPNSSRSGYLNIHSENFGDAMELCPSEPFREQPSAGFCSGFLVGPDILVTAGHCMDSQSRCDMTSFVFDYGYIDPMTDLSSVPSSNVYRCQSIVAQELDSDTKSDFAIVKLDRPVTNRAPLKYKKNGLVAEGTKLVVIGHPSGLPTKVAGDSSVRTSNTTKPFFVANLDTFGGNSGSAVFNEDTEEVEGILVRGDMDFQFINGCYKSNVCEQDACRGEDVTRSPVFAEYLEVDDRPTEIETVTVDGLDTAIPDDNSAGVTQTLNFNKSAEIAAVGVRVKVEHSFPADIRVSLRHPDGTVIDLGTLGVYKDNPKPADIPASRPPVIAERTFGLDGVPVKALRQLRKREAIGDWKVTVSDTAQADSGKLLEIDLKVKTYIP